MKLQQMKYIVEIADCKSMTNAAKKLFVSQPYLSKIVTNFEERVGKPIFIRSNTGLELTAYGHKVYLIMNSIIQQTELLNNMELDKGYKQEVRLAFSVANLIIKDSLILDYLATNGASRSNVDFYETTIEGCIENIEKDLSEFAILVVDDYQKTLLLNVCLRKGMEYTELDEGDLFYQFHRSHPLANIDRIGVDELMQFPLVSMKADHFKEFSQESYKQAYPEVQFPQAIIVNNYHAYLNIVKNNRAFMVGNKWQISELEKMGIESVRARTLKHKMHLGILKKKAGVLSEESLKYIKLFKNAYGLNDI